MERSAQLRSLLSMAIGPGDPAEQLRAVSRLRHELEALETELAADALRAGLSWSRIGAALGVSKQTAHRRHSHGVALLDRAAETQHLGTRAIVSSEARMAVRIARREAAAMGDRAVGTEHLLLGLLQCGDREMTELLSGLGVTVELAREAMQPTVEMTAPPVLPTAAMPTQGEAPTAAMPTRGAPPSAAAPLASPGAPPAKPSAVVSPLARHVLERALAGPARRRSEVLGASDLLQALLRHDNGGASLTLARLGVDPRELSHAIEGRTRGPERRAPRHAAPASER